MNRWFYAALCVLLPAAWGALMYVVFGWVHRQAAPRRPDDVPPADYTI